MQIIKISTNYNNRTSFKGEAEQKLFMQTLKVKELKGVLEESIESKLSTEPFALYFAKAFKKLENHFSKIKTFKKLDKNSFIVKNGKEKIFISLGTEKKPYITYIEGKPFTKDLNQTSSIFYYGEINNPEPHILRQRFIGTAIKKRVEVNLTGVEEKLERGNDSFKFINHGRAILQKQL